MEVFTYETRSGTLRYVIASWSEQNAQYTAGMTTQARRLTGCSGVFARTIEGIGRSPCVATFSTKTAARRALKRIMGDDYE